ncbi:carbohydrate ABC transporter permease [Paenibacillus pasadenensis]|uniref:N-Acetyl-D-glucosamine ABC transport system, permease protein 1 n=1 Tax=Paenibacillus pasadenensis TaxID=217090 RepID=A0A2N5N1Z2_9BACL|nr:MULTISPECIES: sugar ABC transporter permease [Paenibacillus]PLT44357.1 N-Acetyl-D-glucosamine ABC transport system, permease protein 1 [Paenibacillus pasadenensis]
MAIGPGAKAELAPAGAKRKRRWAGAQAFVFLAPFFAVYVLFTIWPMLKGVQISFFKWTLIRKMEYVGLGNFSKLMQDAEFWASVWHSTIFVLLTTPLMLALSLGLALIANRHSRLRKLYRISFFMPSVMSVAVASFLGLFIFQPYTGLLNSLLHLVRLLPAEQEIFWLSEVSLSWIAITALTLWWTVGFNFVLYLSALQEMPEELYEAARLDGATNGQIFRRITLPLLAPITRMIMMLQIIASFKVFLQIYIMTGGGPLDKTRPVIQYIWQTGFRQNDLGYASAMSYVLFFILLALSALQYGFNRRKEAD